MVIGSPSHEPLVAVGTTRKRTRPVSAVVAVSVWAARTFVVGRVTVSLTPVEETSDHVNAVEAVTSVVPSMADTAAKEIGVRSVPEHTTCTVSVFEIIGVAPGSNVVACVPLHSMSSQRALA